MSPSKLHVLPLYLQFRAERVMPFIILPLKCSQAQGEKQKLQNLPKCLYGGTLLFLLSVLFYPYRLYQQATLRDFLLPFPSYSNDKMLRTEKKSLFRSVEINFA